MQLTCPFCFEQFSAQDLRFRCDNAACPDPIPDPVYANARGYTTLPMGRVLVPAKQLFGQPDGVRCDACKVISNTRICPVCHQELSKDIGQVDQRIIAIIGGRATGKTNYIASLITRLQTEVARNFGTEVRMMGEETRIRWERDFYTPLFIRKRVLEPTQRAAVDATVKAPLMFRFIFKDGSRKRAINISFFDSAGEDMTSLATMSAQYRYICHADGIIFLLDPLQIPTVRQEVMNSANVPPTDFKASPEAIVWNLRDLFERQQRLHATQKVKVPVAFTLSKVDALLSLLDSGSALQRGSSHQGVLDLYEVQSVNTEISHYLSEWINPAFMIGVENGFATYNFFGVSSLGDQPDANGQLTTVSPLRVEEPFLWLLYKLGLIKGKKGW